MGRRGRWLACRGCSSASSARPKFSLARSSFSGHLGSVRDAQKAPRDGQEQGKEKQGDGSTLSQVSPRDPGIERQAGEHLRAVIRPAPGKIVDDDHIGEGEDQAEKERHQAYREDERQRYLKVVAPEAGAVYRSRIVDILRNRAESSQ